MPFLQTTLHNSIVSADGMLCVRVALCAYRIHRSVCAERKKPAIVNMISVLRTEMFDTTLLFFFVRMACSHQVMIHLQAIASTVPLAEPQNPFSNLNSSSFSAFGDLTLEGWKRIIKIRLFVG